MKVIDCVQGTAAWHAARHGFVTASECSRVMNVLKRASGDKKAGESGAQRTAYMTELMMSILTGKAPEHYKSDDMEHGTEFEPEARTYYEFHANTLVETIGFAQHETVALFGASPDGLMGNDGGLEIKCPRITTHIKWCKAGVVPPEHYWQCMAGMSVCERQWWDFVSYCPEMPKPMRLFVVRVLRDEQAIADLEAGVKLFRTDLESEVAALEARFGKVPRPSPVIPVRSEYDGLGLTDEDLALLG